MLFATLNPDTHSIEIADYAELHDAVRAAGLDPYQTDHGIVAPGLGIVVFEWSLFAEPHYYAINGSLFNGAAALYAFGIKGETLDIRADFIPYVKWLGRVEKVEEAIKFGKVKRPQTTINGEVVWSWDGKAR